MERIRRRPARTPREWREVCSTGEVLGDTERIRVQTREWLLTAAVIVIPLIIAVAVTMWSLDQVRYRPKKRRPASAAAREAGCRWIAAMSRANEAWIAGPCSRFERLGANARLARHAVMRRCR